MVKKISKSTNLLIGRVSSLLNDEQAAKQALIYQGERTMKMSNEKKTTMKFRFSGILLFCMVLVGSLLLTPATAQAARGRGRGRVGGRSGRGVAAAGRRSGFRRHYRPARRFNRSFARRRHYKPVRRYRRPYRRHYRRGTDWVNFGLTVGNLAWSAANIASSSRDYDYYDDPVIIEKVVEKPVYIVPQSYEDDTDYIILRDWDYTPNTTTTRTEIIIAP